MITGDQKARGHFHDDHEALIVEDDAGNLEGQIIIDALQSVLIDRGLLTAPEVLREIEKLESPGIHLGAKIVARAWADESYKARLLENGKQAIGEIGISVGEAQIVVVENTPTIHNLITCTVCFGMLSEINIGSAAVLVHIESL